MSLSRELQPPDFIVNGRVKHGTWKNIKNHKIYMKWLGKKLGYTCMEDWYNISKKDFKDNYGGGLLSSKYNNCPIKLLKALFTDYKWLLWKLPCTSKFLG